MGVNNRSVYYRTIESCRTVPLSDCSSMTWPGLLGNRDKWIDNGPSGRLISRRCSREFSNVRTDTKVTITRVALVNLIENLWVICEKHILCGKIEENPMKISVWGLKANCGMLLRTALENATRTRPWYVPPGTIRVVTCWENYELSVNTCSCKRWGLPSEGTSCNGVDCKYTQKRVGTEIIISSRVCPESSFPMICDAALHTVWSLSCSFSIWRTET